MKKLSNGQSISEGAQVVGLPALLRPHLHRRRHVRRRRAGLRRALLPQGRGRLYPGESPFCNLSCWTTILVAARTGTKGICLSLIIDSSTADFKGQESL